MNDFDATPKATNDVPAKELMCHATDINYATIEILCDILNAIASKSNKEEDKESPISMLKHLGIIVSQAEQINVLVNQVKSLLY